ncbi:hypothetical protein [Streptomyces luteireticuli]|uniref:hypothetical protein n=1 Tax=Streptomyces luteireticuli TaxID=173858 RepID=UPI0035591200
MLNSISRGLRWLRDALFLDIGPEIPVSPPAMPTPPATPTPQAWPQERQLLCGCVQVCRFRPSVPAVNEPQGLNIVRQPQAGEADR